MSQTMPDNLASCNTLWPEFLAPTIASVSGNVWSMPKARKTPKKPPSELQMRLSMRLKAIQQELGRSDAEMGKLVGVSRTRWGNWVNQENMPAEEAMVALCDLAQVSMEWLYRGFADRVPTKLLIRLEARMAGIDPDTASPEQLAPVVARVAAAVAA